MDIDLGQPARIVADIDWYWDREEKKEKAGLISKDLRDHMLDFSSLTNPKANNPGKPKFVVQFHGITFSAQLFPRALFNLFLTHWATAIDYTCYERPTRTARHDYARYMAAIEHFVMNWNRDQEPTAEWFTRAKKRIEGN